MRRALVLALLGLNGCLLVLDYGDYEDSTGGTTTTAATGGDGAGGAGGTGGAGGAEVCSPGESVDCYSGPDGTIGYGLCSAGQKTCDPQGAGFGECEGEVVPSLEIALNDADEDCDGAVSGQALWKARFGDAEDQTAKHVAVDALGNVVLAGSFQGTLDIGGGKTVGPAPAPGPGMFVARLEPGGAPLWIQERSAAAMPRVAEGVAVDSAGNVTVVGHFVDTAASPDPAGFVLQLDPAGGERWVQELSGTSAAAVLGVAVGPLDAVFAIGRYRGDITLANKLYSSVGGADDVLIVEYDADGNPVWSQSFGGASDDVPRAVAVNGAGEAFVTGEYRGAPAGLPDAQDKMIPGFSAVFVMKTGEDGSVKWKKGFPGESFTAGNARGTSVALDAEGAVWVTGAMHGDASFVSGGLPWAGGADVFLARLDGALGEVLWARSFGDAADQAGTGVAVAEDGGIFVAGTFSGSIDFDPDTTGDELTAQSGQDMFVVKLDSMGKALWSARLAQGEVAGPRDVRLAVHGGEVVLAGGWMGGLDLGNGGVSTPLGGLDVFAVGLTQ